MDGAARGATTTAVDSLLGNAFAWFSRNLENFDPLADGRSSPDLFRSKALLELAFLCGYVRRCGPRPQIAAELVACERLVRTTWDSPIYRERVLREPGLFRLWAATYVALITAPGSSSDRSEHSMIQRVFDGGYVTAVEDVPFRALELRYLLDTGGFTHRMPSYRQLYEQTLLHKGPAVLHMTDFDAYSVTHTLFYLSDFAAHPIADIPDDELPTVCSTVATLLGLYLRRGNWDLVAELLMACQCLRWKPRTIFDLSWTALLAAQRPDGAVTGPELSSRQLVILGADPNGDQYFNHNYHTTIVAALAGGLYPML